MDMTMNNDESTSKMLSRYSGLSGYKIKDADGLEIDLDQILLNAFTGGNYLFLIYNVAIQNIEYTSDGVRGVLGIEPEALNFQYILENMHPEDLPVFAAYEKLSIDFIASLLVHDQLNYKMRYDYRLRNSAGDYVRVLHQFIVVQNDDSGAVYRSLGVLTDISHLKTEGEMSYALIGLNGLPSYFGVDSLAARREYINVLSKRETQVLQCLGKDLSSKQIADILCISVHTVSHHRRNMLKKTATKTTSELLMMAVNNGWV